MPAAHKPRPLLLLAPFTGEKLVVRAASATTQGAVLQVELPEGTRAAYDKNALLATSPWYTDAGLTDGGVDVAALGWLYDNAIREHPEFAASGRSVTVHSIFSPARLGPAQGATRGGVNARAGVAVRAQIRARRRERMEACRGWGAAPIQS